MWRVTLYCGEPRARRRGPPSYFMSMFASLSFGAMRSWPGFLVGAGARSLWRPRRWAATSWRRARTTSTYRRKVAPHPACSGSHREGALPETRAASPWPRPIRWGWSGPAQSVMYYQDQWWPILMAYPYGSQCHGKKYLKNLNNECDPRRVSSLLHPLWLLLPSARPLNSALSMDQWWLMLVNGQAAGITESFSFWLRKHPNKSW